MAQLANIWGLAEASDPPTESWVVGVGVQMCSQTFRAGSPRGGPLGLPVAPQPAGSRARTTLLATVPAASLLTRPHFVYCNFLKILFT